MHTRSFAEIPSYTLPGLQHQTLAGAADGLGTLEVWHQIMAPGAATPLHRHKCEEVVVALRGTGCCEVDGQVIPFTASVSLPVVLIVPPDVVHLIRNTGDEDLVLVAAIGMAPVAVQTPEGAAIPLPWA